MGHKLGSGTRIIRLLLLLGVVVALGGVSCCAGIMTSSPDSTEIRNLCLASIGAFILEGAVCGAVFAMLAARKLLQRVNVMAAALNQCAEGDLTAKITAVSEDELGKLNLNFNTMLDRLAGMAGKVQGSITELVQISGSIREVSLRGKSAAEIQFEGVSGTSLAVEEINQSVNEVAHAVDGLAKLSADNFSSIVEMSTSMESAMQHVEALARAVEEVSSAIAALASSEQEIGNGVVSLMEESLATNSLVDSMDRTIKLVEQNALQAAAISETVKQDAEDGRESVEATISGIGEIHRSSRITSEAIENLSAGYSWLSTSCPTRPTSWPSMPQSSPPRPGNTAKDSPSLPTRSRGWQNVRACQHGKFRRSSTGCRWKRGGR